MFSKIKLQFKIFSIGIRNLIKWFPIIWNDRDFDRSYIMNILLFKMRNTRDFIRDFGYVEDTEREKIVRTMTECIDLLNRVHNEFESYQEPELARFEKVWGKSEFEFVPIEGSTSYKMIDRSEEKLTEEQKVKRNHDYRIHINIAENNRKREFNHAMSIFVENYDFWWD
jgi:hypothetical protein